MHTVDECADLLNPNADVASVLEVDARLPEVSDACACAGLDDCPGFQGSPYRKVTDCFLDVEDHITDAQTVKFIFKELRSRSGNGRL